MCGKNKIKNPAKVLWVWERKPKHIRMRVNGWSAKMACSTAACCHRHPRACAASVVMDVPPAHPHVTYLAFEGRDASVADEVGLSAYSVQRWPGTAVTVLTDSWRMADQLSMRVPKHEGHHHRPPNHSIIFSTRRSGEDGAPLRPRWVFKLIVDKLRRVTSMQPLCSTQTRCSWTIFYLCGDCASASSVKVRCSWLSASLPAGLV